MLSICFAPFQARATDNSPTEEQVKAACILNLPKYVEWPAESFAEAGSPIILAELGQSGVGEILSEMVKGKSVNGHPLMFKRIDSEAELASTNLHLVFIGAAQQRLTPDAAAKASGKATLTVGESEDFLDKGGMIFLHQRERKIQLEINLTAAKQARLAISSKLLSVAAAVRGKAN